MITGRRGWGDCGLRMARCAHCSVATALLNAVATARHCGCVTGLSHWCAAPRGHAGCNATAARARVSDVLWACCTSRPAAMQWNVGAVHSLALTVAASCTTEPEARECKAAAAALMASPRRASQKIRTASDNQLWCCNQLHPILQRLSSGPLCRLLCQMKGAAWLDPQLAHQPGRLCPNTNITDEARQGGLKVSRSISRTRGRLAVGGRRPDPVSGAAGTERAAAAMGPGPPGSGGGGGGGGSGNGAAAASTPAAAAAITRNSVSNISKPS